MAYASSWVEDLEQRLHQAKWRYRPYRCHASEALCLHSAATSRLKVWQKRPGRSRMKGRLRYRRPKLREERAS